MDGTADDQPNSNPRWVLVLHGGAGSIPGDSPDDIRTGYENGVRQAMQVGVELLEQGKSAVDVAEAVVVCLEDSPIFNAGKGSVFTGAGVHELDACIMDGSTLSSGAVTNVNQLKNPIRAARHVMDDTRHMLLACEGAEEFALAAGCEHVDQSYYFTSRRFHALNRYRERRNLEPLATPGYPLEPGQGIEPDASADEPGNTVGCVVLDAEGHLAAATSTGGLNGKMAGRVGDTPIVGAGTYANQFCGVSGTGIGEEYMRHVLCARVAWLVEAGQTPEQAVQHCLTNILKPNQGGLIAIGADGQVTALSNTGSMPHAIADSNGRREIGIWMDPPALNEN
ncbi:isoaspartyl peptidase/L-asparaginase family protein [Aeoliella mucimassa]|uniref:Isoaspartyl peptidase n=1 Tax=Aeoliella mucimassa TaxID=2527972 RepID=A0A518AVH7_9BACT|nr:isoaspartyl peptidase/L-asparaginase [Aeoliella mucimassa]QDU58737.1 Isoaspartyl peptidase precursor [Aeoliella mucimassa]